MKKILLMMILLLLVGCKGDENKEIIKYRLSDNEKLVVELKEDSDLYYLIDGNFYIEYQDNLIGSVYFLNQEQCNNIINDENLEKIKEDEHGFSYKDENYHYLNTDNKICIWINAKELDKFNKILDNIIVRIEKEN